MFVSRPGKGILRLILIFIIIPIIAYVYFYILKFIAMVFDPAILLEEVSFQASRSGGKGGQNVNKVATKVELLFDVNKSVHLTGVQKSLIAIKLASRINAEGILRIVSQEARTQPANKKNAADKFIHLINRCLKEKRKRIPTRIPDLVKEERLKRKKQVSEKKTLRRKTADG